jgi:hypothetical protein
VDIADRLTTMILNSRPVQLPLRVNATVRGPALAEGAG